MFSDASQKHRQPDFVIERVNQTRSEEDSMGKLGKILVFVNLAISLALMIWAMTMFVYRIDWSDTPPQNKDGLPEGEYSVRSRRVKASWQPMPEAENAWRTARANLLKLEEQRRDTRRWYDAELAKLEYDANPKAPTSMREVVLDKNGQPDLDAGPGDPKFPNAIRIKMQAVNDRRPEPKPLYARNVYDVKEADYFTSEDMANLGLYRARTKLRMAVEENVGHITGMLGPKGLHARGQDEKAKRQAIMEESKAVEPLLINTFSSSRFAIEREKELRSRVEELEEARDRLRRKLGVAGEAAP
jgi:hypothetical protein